MPVIQKINTEIVRAMKLPDIREMLIRQGYEAKSSTPAELAALMKEDLAKWNKVVKSSGMQVD